jgi:hypothetical protein
MKVTRLVALSILFAVASAPLAEARPRPAGGGSMKKFSANKTFGLGLELGQPTGLTGKYFLSDSNALDFGVGYIYHSWRYGDDGIHLYADYLWHPFTLVSAEPFELPFFIGVGGRFWDFDYCDRNVCYDDGSALGIRIPLGLAFDFNEVPLDIALNIVPTIDFVTGGYYDRYGDRNHFGIDVSIAIRYWFK